MSIYQSTQLFDEFFNHPGFRNYEKYRTDPNAKMVFEWLKARIDWLISSIRNHRKPALQGVIVDLEELLRNNLGWSREHKDNYFITMIGAMVRFLVEEHGFTVKRTGVPLRHNRIITTAATYRLEP
ncbi:hypothetical protein HQ587_08650 [bacterium]|nr:hypothetical protein [bacterium]